MSAAPEHPRSFSFPFEARTQDEIVSALQTEGVRFRTFECVNEGDYAADDAAWNYMDIPHLKFVHKQVDGVLTVAADALTASIFFQRIPFLRLPLCVFIYQSASNAITYYTSFSIYLVIIQTTWEPLGDVRTRVTTRYAIGWTGWLAGWGFPLIRRLLERNYRILMNEDLPMRIQRGNLRKRGYGFRMTGDVPSFIESRKIMQQNVVTPDQNVIVPKEISSWGQAEVRFETLGDGEVRFIGDANHVGLSVRRVSTAVHVYPRLCPHEGADLDNTVKLSVREAVSSNDCAVLCPWHGRKFRAILTIPLPATPAIFETYWHHYAVGADVLRITCKPADSAAETQRIVDWSQPARRVYERGGAPLDKKTSFN
jgi:nitrite reductase/ring-hydroxylating ferredoxin subunit